MYSILPFHAIFPGMDGQQQQRPAVVPEAAVWSDESTEWQFRPTDDAGVPDGIARSWRPDGTLASETTYVRGTANGPYRRFHPDGSVAREGVFVDGSVDGTVVARGSDQPTTELLQSCCVPQNAWQLQIDYVRGEVRGQRWYDRAGVHILPSGRPFPARPDSVPPEARFEEEGDVWTITGYTNEGQPHGVWRRWSRAGVLLAHEEFAAGQRHGQTRYFQPDGSLWEEAQYAAGVRSGPYRFMTVPAGRYPDERIVEERGSFDRNQAVGIWTLHDKEGAPLRRYDLGIAPPADALAASPAFDEQPPAGSAGPAAAWAALSESLESEGRLGESVLAMARAAVAARDADGLTLLLARRCFAVTPGAGEEMALDIAKTADGNRGLLLNAFGRGADPVGILRTLASALGRSDSVALDIADAAVLLAPARADCRVTRALIRVHMGDLGGATADAAHLPDDWSEQRDFILNYSRVLFPRFDFWPASHPVETLFPEVPDGIDQPLLAVRGCIQKLATRLMALRQAIQASFQKSARRPNGLPPWMPPDVTALLPEGPVALTTWQYDEIVQEEDEAPQDETTGGDGAAPAAAPQPTLVTVDERMPLEALSLPTLMRLARREWCTLTWLCWSSGLDHVALPTELAPPDDFGKACGMCVERLWRCEDKVITGGLRAMSQKVPGFTWEGIAVDDLPPLLAEIATDDYRELRALFFWLCDAGLQSLWQDNLRGNV